MKTYEEMIRDTQDKIKSLESTNTEAMSEADKALIVDAITEAKRYISLLNERIAKLAS